ncbi:uncharacterized protein CGFF_05090 [Nakaseomyces glabratus]|nr:uncharacterized protein CGFF_05090 [Nakaseomyces glabratus]SLM17303.1 uncharacterized protein CGFF_05090 [Nakaseomyces glabratus]
MDIRGRKMKKPPACAQCRRRKVGCDRVRPVCGNCARAGKGDCFYPDVPGQYIQNNGGSHYHRMAVAVPKKSALLIKLENTTQDFSYLTWMVMNCRKRQSSISLGQVLSHIIKKSLVVVL